MKSTALSPSFLRSANISSLAPLLNSSLILSFLCALILQYASTKMHIATKLIPIRSSSTPTI